MNGKKNLWGELPTSENLRTPYSILKEQASILSEITDGLLIGEVVRYPSSAKIQEDKHLFTILRIKAPALNNYTYSVVDVQYPIQLYPLTIRSLATKTPNQQECQTEDEFETALGAILSSDEVKRVLAVLLAQIRADISA